MNRHTRFLPLFLAALFVLAGCTPGAGQSTPTSAAAIHFVDDMGNTIALDRPCQRIISLYSAHTENLYSLGAGDAVLGVSSTSIFPPDAAFKPIFDYDSDPEKVIAAAPDCLLIRPFIDRKNPDFVSAIKKAGIPVISLYPEKLDAFKDYIQKLGLLSGKEEKAGQMLAQFDQALAAIGKQTAAIEPKKTVYFESTAENYRTVTPNSMAGNAITYAGGINIARDATPITEGSSIAAYGVEKILLNADKIDVYITQRGAMNAGDNAHSIAIREGFSSIKAVREDNILEINEKLISAPTFRFTKGVNEIARALYPEVMDDISGYRSDSLITRQDFATIILRYTHKPIYVTASSKYYQETHEGHVYGLFRDIPWDSPNFDAIETAVIAGFIAGKKDANGEYFDPQGTVSTDEFAQSVFLLRDFARQESHRQITDLKDIKNDRIVQILVDNNVFPLDAAGNFHPQQQLTYNEVIDTLAAVGLK